jgi:hypothetical protein
LTNYLDEVLGYYEVQHTRNLHEPALRGIYNLLDESAKIIYPILKKGLVIILI